MNYNYLHLAYLSEISIALNIAYAELFKSRRIDSILRKRDDLSQEITKTISARFPENPIALESWETGKRVLKKLKNLDSLNEHDFKNAWLTDECRKLNSPTESCSKRDSDKSISECLKQLDRGNCETHEQKRHMISLKEWKFFKIKKYPDSNQKWAFFKNKKDTSWIFLSTLLSLIFIIGVYPFESLAVNWLSQYPEGAIGLWWVVWFILSITTALPLSFVCFLRRFENQFTEKIAELTEELKKGYPEMYAMALNTNPLLPSELLRENSNTTTAVNSAANY